MELVMGVGPMNLVITNDALYQLSYTSAATRIIAKTHKECKSFFQKGSKKLEGEGGTQAALPSGSILCGGAHGGDEARVLRDDELHPMELGYRVQNGGGAGVLGDGAHHDDLPG